MWGEEKPKLVAASDAYTCSGNVLDGRSFISFKKLDTTLYSYEEHTLDCVIIFNQITVHTYGNVNDER